MKLFSTTRHMGLAEQAFWVVAIPFVIELVFAVVVGKLLDQIQTERQEEIHTRELAEHIGLFMQAALDRGTVAFCRRIGDPDALQARFYNDARRTGRELDIIVALVKDHAEEKRAIDDLIETKARLDRTQEAANFAYAEGTSPRTINSFRHLRDLMIDCIRKMEVAIDNTKVSLKKTRVQQANLRFTLEWVLFSFMALNLVAAAVLAARFNRKAVQRLKILMDNTNRIASGQPLHWQIEGNDEIAELDMHLRKMQAVIDQATDRESAVTEHAVDVICELNENRRFVRINLAVSKLWGYDKDELLGETVATVIVEEDLPQVLLAFEEAAQKHLVTTVEARIRRKDRSTAFMRWSINSTIEDESTVCIIHDITAEKEIEQLKHDLVGMVSHDLRTPLSSLVITHELFSSGAYGELSDDGLRNLAIASRNAGQLLLLVNNILDVEKLEAGHLELAREPVPVNQMLEAAVQSVFQFADQHDIKVVMPPPGNVTTLGDKDKLAQVMASLIALGIASVSKASALHMAVSRKGTDVTIELVVTASAEELALAAEHDQLAAGKRGSDASASRAEGVSLSLSKAIIEKLGGTVGVAFDHDIRAIITVTFANQSVALDRQVGTTG